MNIKHITATTVLAAIGLAGLVAQQFNVSPPAIKVRAFGQVETDKQIQADAMHAELVRQTVIAASIYEANGCNPWLAERTAKHAMAAGLPANLVAADVVVESTCRPSIVSARGAVGLMQVNDRVWKTGVDLRDPDKNLEVGTKILAGYVKRYGLQNGLWHYLGTGSSDGVIDGPTYADRVLQVAYNR